MNDMTKQNPDENNFEANILLSQANLVRAKAEKASADAEQAAAEAKKTEAERKLADAKSKSFRSRVKRIVVGLGIGGALVGGGVVGYRMAKGYANAADKHPEAIEKSVEGVVDGVFSTLEATGKTAESVGGTVQTTVERIDQFFSRPDLNQFLAKIENSSGRFGTRTLQANSWTQNHPDRPISKEQLNALLQAKKDFFVKKQRAMTVKEVNKAAQKICGWEKVSPQTQKARQNGGR